MNAASMNALSHPVHRVSSKAEPLKTTRSILPIGTLALAGAALMAAAPPAALGQAAAIRLNPELHNARANFALMGNDTIIYTSSADISGTTVGANDQVWRAREGLYLSWQNNKPWGWEPMNADTVNAASGSAGGGPVSSRLVYDAPRQRIYYRDDAAGDLGYLQGPNWTSHVFAVTGSIEAGTHPCVEPSTGRVYYHEAASDRLYLCDPINGGPGVTTSTTWAMHPSASPVWDHHLNWGVYARSHDNRLVITRWQDNQFVASWPGDPIVFSDPAVNRAGSVIFQGPTVTLSNGAQQNAIYSMWESGGVWQAAMWGPTPPPAVGRVTGAPTVGTWSGVAYYAGGDKRLWSCTWNGSQYVYKQETTQKNCAGDILVNSAGTVFFRGTPDKLGNYSIWRKP